MRALLLGGTGFIGRATVRALERAGHQVITASRSTAADVRLDVTDVNDLRRVLTGAQHDVVVNLVGTGLDAGTADPVVMACINSALPADIFEVLAERSTPLVHVASSTERLSGQSSDESEYSRTKHAGSVLLRTRAEQHTSPLTVLTLHNTYGREQPSSRFVAATIAAIRARHEVVLNYPARIRDFVFVDDAAASICRAIEEPPAGFATAEIGTGHGLSLHDAATTIARVLGAPPDLVRASGAAPEAADPNPVTVCPVRFGTYGMCTTDFDDGVRRTVED